MKVVELKKNPPVNDIPAWLRKIADEYEAGEYPGVDYMMVIWPAVDQENDWPEVRGLGNDPGTPARVGLVSLVLSWFTINMVARRG